jgi:HlyD family secretion protein
MGSCSRHDPGHDFRHIRVRVARGYTRRMIHSRRTRWTCVAVAVATAGLGFGVFAWRRASPSDTPPPVADAASGLGIGCLGRVEPASRVRRLAPPSSLATDRLTELRVVEGERVASGQVLGWFGDHDVRVAAVGQAEAELAWTQARLQQIQAGAKKDDIAAAEARLSRVRAAEANARRQWQRNQSLVEGKVISASESDDCRFACEMAEAARRAAEHELASIAEVRPVDVRVAEADVARARATLDRARAELAMGELRAPASGTILKIHTRPGESPGPAGVLEMGDLDELHVAAEVYETDVMRVRLGQSARILIHGSTQTLRGEVVDIGWEIRRKDVLNTDPVADIDARVVEVRVRVDPRDAPRLVRLTNMQVSVVIEGDAAP